jgi:hypothetical protein
MKKLYYLAILLIAFGANAQFEIDFDDMSPGNVSPQSDHIVLWPAAGVTDAQVTNEQAFSGTQSIVMREQPGNNTFDDILVNVGNKTSGTWSVTWMMYIPSGKVGFWNIQENESVNPAPRWNGQFFAGLTSSGGSIGEITFDMDQNVFAPYPDNEWFSVTHVIDLDNGTHTVDINGTLLLDNFAYQGYGQGQQPSPSTQLGSINFYSIDTNNRYYIDDFKLIEGNVLSTNDFETQTFSVYPNPVGNQLNIKSNDAVSDVTIYNVLGSLVHRSAPNAVSPSIDMSSFKSGVYFVEVTINNSRKTVKIVK